MTDTMTETEITTKVIEIDWSLLNALASVSASASTDKMRYLLVGVHLFSDGADLVVEATDSFTLARARVEFTTPEIDVLVEAKWLTDALKATKPRSLKGRTMTLPVMLSVTGSAVTFSASDVTMTTTALEGKFPSVDHLIPTPDKYTSELGAFNPTFLARMAKMLTTGSTDAWECVTMSSTMPALWNCRRYVGGSNVYGQFLIMPVRIK